MERGRPKVLILNVSQGDKIHQVPVPYFTKANKAGRSEIGAGRVNQGPAYHRLAHRAAINTKQERANPLTQVGLSLKWTANSSETIHYWK